MRFFLLIVGSLAVAILPNIVTGHLPQTVWFTTLVLVASAVAVLLGHARWLSGDRSVDPRILLAREAWLHPLALRRRNRTEADESGAGRAWHDRQAPRRSDVDE